MGAADRRSTSAPAASAARQADVGRARRPLAWLRRELLRHLSLHPGVYLPLYRRWGAQPDLAVNADTEIVIEGYPRSANTFAVVAFEMAQGRALRAAHHLHAAAQVKEAARRGLPCIVLLRAPLDAVASLLVREPQRDSAQAVAEYVAFYATVEPLRSGFELALFDAVTTRFGDVIRGVNARFGTSFVEFAHTAENARAVFERVDGDAVRRLGAPQTEARVARPAAARADSLDVLRERLRDGATGGAIARAERVYERLIREA